MAIWESRDNNRCLNKPFNMAPNFALFLVMHLSILIYSRFLNMPPVLGALEVTCQKSHGCPITWEWGHMGTLHGNTSHGLVNKKPLIEFHNLMCIIFAPKTPFLVTVFSSNESCPINRDFKTNF